MRWNEVRLILLQIFSYDLSRHLKYDILTNMDEPQDIIRDLVTYCVMGEACYQTRSFKDLCDAFGLTPRELENNFLERVNAALEKRGCSLISPPKPKPEPQPRKPKDLLDATFVLAVDLLSDITDKRSKSAKLKAAGISTMRFDKFLDKPNYRDYFLGAMDRVRAKAVVSGDLALIRNVENGDLQSIKYFYELTGKYRGEQETVTNLVLLLAKVMEVLAKHVDPAVLQTVADELESAIEIEPLKELSA